MACLEGLPSYMWAGQYVKLEVCLFGIARHGATCKEAGGSSKFNCKDPL